MGINSTTATTGNNTDKFALQKKSVHPNRGERGTDDSSCHQADALEDVSDGYIKHTIRCCEVRKKSEKNEKLFFLVILFWCFAFCPLLDHFGSF